jgi:dGTPase
MAKQNRAFSVGHALMYRPSDYDRQFGGKGTGFDRREPHRSDFRKDYARLIHSGSFRRLVGKTQLFPGWESDFFRNRLTHSLEVAQIAKSIAIRLNSSEKFLRRRPIDTDLIEVAGLAHDLGHPPFGHNGELALDYCMRRYGGFEGNAQTLRILTRIEKKVTSDIDGHGVAEDGRDLRYGLDLSARTLAAILKYDKPIPRDREVRRDRHKVRKGYYASEIELVKWIKECVTGSKNFRGKFKTVECQIMDIADDIAYSTYDLEDAFRGDFLTPLQMLAADNELIQSVADEINAHNSPKVSIKEVRGILLTVFGTIADDSELLDAIEKGKEITYDELVEFVIRRYRSSSAMARIGYARTQLTSALVGDFIDGVTFVGNERQPHSSVVELDNLTRRRVEVLKRFAYVSLIQSSRLKVAELRGKEIVSTIFATLSSRDGFQLLPDDYRRWCERLTKKAEKMRVVCDFVAGMTDRYAVEFYARLKSETPQSIFKPL